jgi:hypothetical protein
MSDPRTLNFNDRRTASNAAKQAMLAKFKPKPTVIDPDLELRRLEKEEELERHRAERAEARKARKVVQADVAAKKAEEDALLADARQLARRAAQRAALEQYAAARRRGR